MKKHYTIIVGAVAIAAFTILLIVTMIVHNREKRTASIRPHTAKPLLTNSPTGSTLTSIQNEIAKREYHITFDSVHHALQSPNRLHNLRAYYHPGKLAIQNRIDSIGQNFRMELVNEGIYADGSLIANADSDAVSHNSNDTLIITHPGFAEEFINNQAGIRQNFIITRAPAHTQQLSVHLSVHGLQARQPDSGHLIFYSNNSGKETDRLTYSDLKCWDAEGKPLTASIALIGKQIELNVDVANAAYPVTIDPIIANGSPANADKTLEINQSYAWLGFSVSTAGDVNGDGYSDVLIGAPKYDNGQADEGAAFLYPGTASGISLAATVLECNQANAQMGYSVSNAGDINKDGFSDIMVGAPYYDASASNEGVVMIYKGSAAGIVANNPSIFKLDQAEANLGISVALAGDVNGDGHSDMLAGAHQFDNDQSNEGVGVLILGAPNGLGSVTFLECNQANAMMGFAVAGAGDVDGDGFSDVMAGARLYSNGQALEGAAFVFKGSANGVITANPTIIESNQIDARLGHALSSAGDVNGDGFSDIALGAYQYDKGSSNEGVVMIHYGSAIGINTVPSLTLESDQTEAQFGISVACAGDVNGDGFADLLVGARYFDKGQNNEGAAFIYQGSKDGLSATPVSTLESDQGDAWLGSAVAPAGDVNGDGYGDIIIGAYGYNNGQSKEGVAFVCYDAGGSINTRNNLRLYNTDLTTPINHTQFPQNNFGAGLFSKSFTGRNKGKLVWETRPTGQGFSKGSNNCITNSTQSTGSQNAYSNLGTAGLELKNVIDKQGSGTKVRVRVKYDPVLALTGQSYGPWRYLPAYLMGNSTAPVPEAMASDLSETTQKKAMHLDDGQALELATIYPNPVSNRLNIDFKDKGQVQNLKILTAAGAVVYQSNGFQPFIDVTQFSEGAYFLIITKTDGSLICRNILINR